MAGTSARFAARFWILGVLSVSGLGMGYGYRLSAFQHRQFPQSAPVSNLENPLTWAGHNGARDRAAVPWRAQDILVEIPYALTRHLLDSATPAADDPSDRNHMSKKWWIVTILTPASLVAFGIFILVLVLWACKGRRKCKPCMRIWTNQSTLHRQYDDNSSSESFRWSTRFRLTKSGPSLSPFQNVNGGIKSSGSSTAPCSLAYSVLQAATNNFSSSNLLGEGSFGHVYKARLDYDVYAAVKRLTNARKQAEKEFQAEVDLMSKIRHPNLVALLGYSNNGPEPLIVYELMHNGSLHDQLHGPSRGSTLTWHLRLKIALEAARGLEHLHEHCKPAIIHRDFKASNILLDTSFNAKVSDFGLAVALEEGDLLKDDLQVQGTFGYIAPEYLMDGTLTEKSDVYGFGVVLLELLTGRLPIDTSLPLGSQSLVTWATPMLTNRAKLMDIIDPSLQDTVHEKHLHQVAAVAVLCVQAEASYRPLIADVVQSLVPLVPQVLGGALRDPKTKCFIDSSSTKLFDPAHASESMDDHSELQSLGSQRDSDHQSLCSLDPEPPNQSSILHITSQLERSWEDATRHLKHQPCAGQGSS